MGSWVADGGATAGNDQYLGDAGFDLANGLAGDDVLEGGLDGDLLNGGDGDDLLLGETAGSDYSAAGADSLHGGAGDDVIFGGGGADILDGGDGDDSIITGAGHGPKEAYGVEVTPYDWGADVIDGGAGNDWAHLDYHYATQAVVIDLTDVSAVNAIMVGGVAHGSLVNVESISFLGGQGADHITASVGNNFISGGGGDDWLQGGAGNDMLRGDSGRDTMIGGLEGDLYEIDNAYDTIVENAGEGFDQLIVTSAFKQAFDMADYANVEVFNYAGTVGLHVTAAAGGSWISAGAGADTLQGGAGDDVLSGGAGNDTLIGGDGTDFLEGGLGADTLIGGRGDDHYSFYGDIDPNDVIIEDADGGIDDVILYDATYFSLVGANVENITLARDVALTAIGNALGNRINAEARTSAMSFSGGDGDDQLTGGEAADHLRGDAGDDVLDGGGGDDALEGGGESDALSGGGGADLLDGGSGNDTLSGDAGDDQLIGGAGDDTLKGGGGHDTLVGGTGADRYDLDDTIDTIVENLDEGFDQIVVDTATVRSTFNLADYANVEAFSYAGWRGLQVTAAAGGNTITTGQGDDALYGGDGNDTLDGGWGADMMAGGRGDDTYYIRDQFDANDMIVENAGEGVDTVILQHLFSPSAMTLANNVENLSVLGDAPVTAFGNALENHMSGQDQAFAVNFSGGDGDDRLSGGAAGDRLWGESGGDALAGGGGDDELDGGAGADYLGGDAGDDRLDGGADSDTLSGGGGGDRLTGGAGGDVFLYGAASDSRPDAYDIITDFTTGADLIVLNSVRPIEISLVTSGAVTFLFVNTPTGQMTVAANGQVNGVDVITHDGHGVYMIGDGAANTLIGGVNGDVIQSGAGDDVIIGGGGGDVLFGQDGADTFRYLSATDSNAAAPDGIYQFQTGVDTIDLGDARPLNVSLIRSGGSTFLFAGTAAGTVQLATVGHDLNGQDIVTGDGRGVYMIGDDDANTFIGGVNGDIIQSGAGADVIIGGGGGDVLYGQAGADIFKYLAASDSTAAHTDSIFDFQSGTDRLDLTAVRTGASDVLGVYSTGGSTFVFVDLHGDGVGDMTIQLNGTASITSGDYLF